MGIRIYNTMTREKEDFVPRDEGRVAMYVCGPTVYNYIHVGNARTFLNFDMIRRYLLYRGYKVFYVQNITDVDDKIINRAKEEGTTPDEVARKYTAAFEEDMRALGVLTPDVSPKATEHITDMIRVIEVLVEKGFAYVSDGDVYFEVGRLPDYGKLSGRDLSEQRVIVQFEEELKRKRNPLDFALWKSAKPGEPWWESPWGKGRPGWHIECSTMSVRYLGEDFDIHGGGLDLVFPHHENEIAQAEAYSGKRFARYWIHSGMLNIDQEKMSKSLGNIKLLREVLLEHEPDVLRMLALQTHYRSPLNYSDESLGEAAAALDRLRTCIFNLRDTLSRLGNGNWDSALSGREAGLIERIGHFRGQFESAMDDDFNTALALGHVFSIVKEANSFASFALKEGSESSRVVIEAFLETLFLLTGSLGLLVCTERVPGRFLAEKGAASVESREPGHGLPDPAELVELLLQVRQKARERKEFETADEIRDGLSRLGVRVEDVPGGYRWRTKR